MFKTIIRAVMGAYKKTWIDSDRTEIMYCLQACRKVSFLPEPPLILLTGYHLQKQPSLPLSPPLQCIGDYRSLQHR